ncbi:expressed unknown protein [Seminavis robusta]|uniref:Uncharacterized protein n=1 Tax=Seminavis robusta TaxID=568900 RepID=A0A9N8EA21_9STRA|nr:expressed unknown protein [Seminavis robusta]|eukprot:Sro866_g213040.1 n/a (202) ;mRNA; r:28648-29253
MFSLDQSPLPMLPTFDNVTPVPPKRGRRTTASLNRRVRAHLDSLTIPDIQKAGGVSAPLMLQPQGRSQVGGVSFESILLGGRNKTAAAAPKAPLLASPLAQKAKAAPTIRGSPARRAAAPVFKTSPLKNAGGAFSSGPSLMSLRMAAMVKGTADAKAQLKYGSSGPFNKQFQAPGRTRSSPYRPSRAVPTMRSRSFNAVCA